MIDQKIALIPLATFFAGFVDSIGGGGGLISTPSLLIAGISPDLVLGTNKCISSIGSLSAVLRYRSAQLMSGHADRLSWLKRILVVGIFAFLGAICSTWKPLIANLKNILPIVLLFVLTYLIKKWYFSSRDIPHHLPTSAEITQDQVKSSLANNQTNAKNRLGFISLLMIGFYDGLLGPGTGIFFLSRLEKKGFKTETANAVAKVFNISSNIGALIFFSLASKVDWKIGFIGASTYLLGNFIGAGLALKRGKNLIRFTVCTVACLTIVKLLAFS